MTLFDWLVTPTGQTFAHAVVLLVVSAAAYLSYLAHQQVQTNSEMLNHHLDMHLADALREAQEAPVTLSEPPPSARPAP